MLHNNVFKNNGIQGPVLPPQQFVVRVSTKKITESLSNRNGPTPDLSATRTVSQMKKITSVALLTSVLVAGCTGTHEPGVIYYPPVPAIACGVAKVAATALSSDVRFIDPVNVSDAGGLSEHPSIATSSGGKVYVAWDDDKNLNKDIFFRRSDDFGSTYALAVNISNTGSATVPVIGVGSDLTVHAAWQDISSGPSEIRYARSIDGGTTFLGSTQISSINISGDIATQAEGVSLAVDSSTGGTGNIYLAWSESNRLTATFSLKIARSTDNGVSFSVVNTYVPTNASATTVALNVDASGNLHVSWSESTSGDVTVRTIHYAKSTDAKSNNAVLTLSAPILLASGTTLSSPTIATDAVNNQVYIAWRDEDDTRVHFSVSGDSGTSFSPEASIVAGNATAVSISPRLAIGPDGTLYLSWTDNRGGNYDTHYSKSTDRGVTFTTPVNFAPSAQGSLFTAIAVDDQSNVYIAWDDNRYPNPPDTPEEVGSEGNFEILVARGKLGLPAVQDARASPCPMTPNDDLNSDTTTFTSQFSESLNWTLDISAPDGSSVFTQTGSGTSITQDWDGRSNGAVVADGLYTYTVTGFNATGVASTSATGTLSIYTTAQDAAPEIVVIESTQTSTFQREAFGFSPNGDGFKDSNGISAQFNKPVNWKIEIKDNTETIQRTLTGSGIALDSEVTRWDGKNSAGTVLPEGNYTVVLTITDGNGLSDSCGVLPVPCLNMEIDTTPPDVPDAAVDQATITSGGTLSVLGTPTELALITIYVYNQVGVLVRKIDRNYQEADLTFSVLWNGKNSNGQNAERGSYEVYVWCRDRAGNTAVVYPRKLAFTIN